LIVDFAVDTVSSKAQWLTMRNEHPSLEDRELVEGIRCGQTGAENEFVRRYTNPVRAMMVARTRHHDDAEDLVQDTLLAVLRALRRGVLASNERLEAFVHGTARNVANNYLRARAHRPFEVPLSEDIPARPIEPEWESAERLRLALAALARKPGLDGEILRLSLVDGLRPSEIGRSLHLAPELVRSRKSRAAHWLVAEIAAAARSGHTMK
jgi:RNA polymerase sigma factor (sigma-70 family)